MFDTRPAYDFTDPENLTALYPLLARLQREVPVYWSEQLNAWVVTRYADVIAALRDPVLSNRRLELVVGYQLRDSDPAIAKDYERISADTMLFRDGAEHHRLRTLGNRGFTPSALERARPTVQRIVDQLLDKVQAAGRMDVVTDLAQPLPSLTIAELFGIPKTDRDLFQKWSHDAAKFLGGNLTDPPREAKAANDGMLGLEAYFLNLIKHRQGKPGDDLLSLLLAGQAEGRLSAEEVSAQCILILIAGHVTTIDLTGNAINALLDHPDQWRALVADPSQAPAAVEEALRYDPAVPFIYRIVRGDTQIGGQKMGPGQVVYIGLGAANRDPAVFANPDAFDIARPNRGDHVSFAAGPHVCLGAGLARRELEVALTGLARRMPNLRRGAEPPVRRCENIIFRGFHSLPVEF
ncbi:MAG: cytochrome P450 [Planctomycetes bacterium]|nr:cytochrome P450 [Planctomycetota bacterium]